MTIRGIITLLVLVVLFALAVIWISKKGGWSGGCGGNCASCHQHCDHPEEKKKYHTRPSASRSGGAAFYSSPYRAALMATVLSRSESAFW